MVGLAPCCAAIPGPLVETGLAVARVCEVGVFAGVFGDGEGEGDGVIVGEGEGKPITGGNGGTGAAWAGACMAAEVLGAR